MVGWKACTCLFRQIDGFGNNDALMARVAEQKVTLEHLLDMMEPQAGDADVASMPRN